MEWVSLFLHFSYKCLLERYTYVDNLLVVSDCKKEQAILNMISNDLMDIRWQFILVCYNPDFVSRYSSGGVLLMENTTCCASVLCLIGEIEG